MAGCVALPFWAIIGLVNSRALCLSTTLTFAFVLLSACSNPPERKVQKFSGRLLVLNGSASSGADLVEVSAAPDGSIQNQNTIAGGVFEAVANADQTQLLYATKDEILLRDLAGGTTKAIVKGQSYCLAWAPDGKRFSYKQRSPKGLSTKLYVSDLDGKNKLIWDDTSGLESAQSKCAQWIAPDRIVFDRFVGMIQKNASSQALKPNTSTIANVDPVKFVDSPRKWSVRAACPSGAVFLTPADERNPTFIATRIDRLNNLNTIPGPSDGQLIGLAAKSCFPFFIAQSASTTTDLFSLNPTNWQKLRTAAIQHTFSANARFVIRSSARLMIAGDAPDKLLLIDTESGDVTKLAAWTGAIQSPLPIVWIEN